MRGIMRISWLLAIIASVTVFAAPPSASDQTNTDRPAVQVVADEWPPFSGESLPGRGISVDVISTVLRRAGYTVEADIVPWARIMAGARSGEYDIVGSLFFDPEIDGYMAYSAPFYQTSVKFVRRGGAGHRVEGMEDLAAYSIAVGDGFLYEKRFDRASDLDKVVVGTTLQGIQMVAAGRVDLTLDSEEVIAHAIRVQDRSLQNRVEVLPFVLATHGVHMAVSRSRPDHPQIVADFNRVLGEMQADGSLNALLAKHR